MKQKVRILVGIASPTWSYAPGETAEIDAREAERWIKHGIAIPIEPSPGQDGKLRPPEAAAVEPPENAAMPRPRKRKAGR